MKNLLFVGGSWNGRVIGVNDNVDYINAPLVDIDDVPVISNNAPELVKMIEYRRETLAGEDGKRFDVMFYRDSSKELIEMLINGYAKN